MHRKIGRFEVISVLTAFFLLGMVADHAPVPSGAAAGLLAWLISVKWSE